MDFTHFCTSYRSVDNKLCCFTELETDDIAHEIRDKHRQYHLDYIWWHGASTVMIYSYCHARLFTFFCVEEALSISHASQFCTCRECSI